MSNSVMNTGPLGHGEDIPFPVSRYAVWRVAEMARQQQRSQGRVFRALAYQLANADAPKFKLSGQPLDRVLRTALHPMIYDLLIDLAAKLGVPKETIGELVASYNEEDANVA